MIYVKNGELRDSKKFLKTEDGRTIFNAKPEQWAAEGWVEYNPQEEAKVIKLTPSLEDVQENLISECEAYYDSSVLKFWFKGQVEQEWIPAQDRVTYIKVLEDVLAADPSNSVLFWKNYVLDAKECLEFLKRLNVYEFNSRNVKENHIRNIRAAKTIEEVEKYDITKDYPTALSF